MKSRAILVVNFHPHDFLDTYYPRAEKGTSLFSMHMARVAHELSEEASAYRLGVHARDYISPGVRR